MAVAAAAPSTNGTIASTRLPPRANVTQKQNTQVVPAPKPTISPASSANNITSSRPPSQIISPSDTDPNVTAILEELVQMGMALANGSSQMVLNNDTINAIFGPLFVLVDIDQDGFLKPVELEFFMLEALPFLTNWMVLQKPASVRSTVPGVLQAIQEPIKQVLSAAFSFWEDFKQLDTNGDKQLSLTEVLKLAEKLAGSSQSANGTAATAIGATPKPKPMSNATAAPSKSVPLPPVKPSNANGTSSNNTSVLLPPFISLPSMLAPNVMIKLAQDSIDKLNDILKPKSAPENSTQNKMISSFFGLIDGGKRGQVKLTDLQSFLLNTLVPYFTYQMNAIVVPMSGRQEAKEYLKKVAKQIPTTLPGVFKQMDVNGDGQLSQQEFEQQIDKMDQLVPKMKVNGTVPVMPHGANAIAGGVNATTAAPLPSAKANVTKAAAPIRPPAVNNNKTTVSG